MKSNRQSFLWLAAGAVFMLFANGRWIIPFATWFFPIFFLRFLRMQKSFRGFIFLVLTVAFVSTIAWWKMIPAPVGTYFMIVALPAPVYCLPFLADRLIATRMSPNHSGKGFLSTLVFPMAFCTIEYLASFDPMKGSWNSLAYTQTDDLSLLQLVSITGIWGISFLVTWFASVVNWAWSRYFQWKNISKGVITFASVASAIFLFGTLRMNFFQSRSSSVLTASIVQSRTIDADLKTCKWTDAKAIGKYSDDVEHNLLQKTRQAAHAGAKMILWQECAGTIPSDREAAFLQEAKTIAAQEKIYLLATLWSVPADFPKHLVENKMIIIDPEGSVRSAYVKNKPVVGAEPIVKGTMPMPILETSFGKIATAICHDGDFPSFMRNAGKNRAEIMFLPANDGKEIDPIHTRMAITRAIENGCSLVHPAGKGLSVATDNRGQIISSMDYFKTDEQVMFASVPIKNSFTIYAQVGDVFAWLCITGLFIFLIAPVVRKYLWKVKSYSVADASQKIKTGPELS
jgi:apolipoprotein N-acyltransferase